MPIKYVPFVPEPIEGQAVLNFNRILKYRGADDTSMILERGMPLYEVEKLESVGENKDGNMVIRGECVSACAYLKEQGIQVDLVYIDPPFASGADYAKKVYVRRNPKVAEAIAKAEEELDIDDLKAFEEKMYGDVWQKERYLNWMWENLMAIKSVMSETASIYVHLDWHIWHYYNKMQGNVNHFASNHDIILVYKKTDKHIYNPIKIKRNEPVLQIKRVWDGNNGKLVNAKDKDGKVVYIKSEFMKVDDVWRISMLQPSDKTEPVGYATQKPESLIERIITASSKDGMIVADFFGGSGVTAAVGNRLGRRFIHCDIGINSIQTTRDRLVAGKAEFDILEIKDGIQLYRNPAQTMDKIKTLIPGLKEENGLSDFWLGAITDSKYGLMPVYVPNLMDSNTKLLDKVLMNRIIHQHIPDLDSNIKKVIVYYVDITSEEKIKKFINDDDSTTVEIELRDLKTVLDNFIISDYVEYHIEEAHEDLFKGFKVCIDKFLSDRVLNKILEFNNKSMLNTKKNFKPIEISEEGLEFIEFLSLDCTSDSGEWHSDSELKIDKNGYVILNGTKTKDFWNGSISCEKKPLRLKIRNICGDETIWSLEE